jgi:hypothetical protein
MASVIASSDSPASRTRAMSGAATSSGVDVSFSSRWNVALIRGSSSASLQSSRRSTYSAPTKRAEMPWARNVWLGAQIANFPSTSGGSGCVSVDADLRGLGECQPAWSLVAGWMSFG